MAALEKIPGVGSLRSSSVGSSLPSLNMDNGQQRLRREEESSHSLGLQSVTTTTTTAAVNGQVRLALALILIFNIEGHLL